MKVVIIGGVAGGATAAARLRRLDERAEIVVLERSGYISYANCGLPYYVGGVIAERDSLTLRTPADFWERFRVDVRIDSEMTEIDRARKTVTVAPRGGKPYLESYDKLILATGARPVLPPVPGMEDERVFTLRTVEDAERLRACAQERRVKSAVVVGAGFIGVEVAENLTLRGAAVTLVDRVNQILPPFDPDVIAEAQNHLRQKGVRLLLGRTVQAIERTKTGLRVVTDGGAVEADLVAVAAGVAPESELAGKAGLETGLRGAVATDEAMRTSDPDILCAGDAAQIRHLVTGGPAVISLAGPANKEGRVAADTAAGLKATFSGGMGTSVVKIFDLTAAATGLSERAAKEAGIACDVVIGFSPSHAAYYPGAKNMTYKVLADKSGRIIGAQIVGGEGVDKRIDVLATAIYAKLTADDLTRLDLAYAPPYGSAKDPVNVAGYMLENLRAGLVRQFFVGDVARLVGEGATFVDVRTPEEFAAGHIEGAINLPLDELRERLNELPRVPLYVNCQSGLRSYLACRILTQNGFECYNLAGGYRYYAACLLARSDLSPAHPCGVEIGKK